MIVEVETLVVELEGGTQVEAIRREDLPGRVFEHRGDGGGARLWRVDGAGKAVECTKEFATAVRAARAATSRRVAADRERIAAADATTTVAHQERARGLVKEIADAAGAFLYRARSPLQKLHGKRLLTGRQFSAGQVLHEDSIRATMVRQPPDPDAPRDGLGDGGGACWETGAIEAANRITAACRLCDTVNPLLWPVVQAVVIQEQTVSELAGSDRARDRRPFMTALRLGLDVVGDCYGMPDGYITTKVFVGGITVPCEMIEDADQTWRARSLNGRSWQAEAKTVDELYRIARAEMLARVRRIIGEGDHDVKLIAQAVEADRRASEQREQRRARAASEVTLQRVHEVIEERRRVVKR